MKVELAVYDLSRGLASSMSEAILGQRIDGIWHTGVIVFNKEWYYGGGIQTAPIGAFSASNGIPISQTINLGETNKTLEELQAFIRSISNRFTAFTYDLIRNNCNNFSNELSLFLCNKPIPSFIIDLPNIVFNSPKGAMLRPMIENIQRSVYQSNNNTLDPFNNSTSNYIPSNISNNQSNNQSNNFENNLSNQIHNALLHDNSIQKAILEENQLISNDLTSINILSKKIIDSKNENGENILTSNEIKQLNDIIHQIQSKSYNFKSNDYILLYNLSINHKLLQMSSLFILRLMILHLPNERIDIDIVINGIINSLKDNIYNTIPAITMALCFLSNLLSTNGLQYIQSNDLSNKLLDLTASYLNHERIEIRNISSVILYNYTLQNTKSYQLSNYWKTEDNDTHPEAVQILLCSFDNITNENDMNVRKRRLSTICRLIRTYGTNLGKLARELGFIEIIQALQDEINKPNKLNKKDKEYEESILIELAVAFT